MAAVILCPNVERDTGLTVASRAAELARSAGFDARVFPFFGSNFEQTEAELRSALSDAALIVAFGGDGTILRVARVTADFDVPVIGVNMGGMGFLAELELADLEMIPAVASGGFTREERMLLDVELFRDGASVCRDFALNDAVIASVSKMIDITVFGDAHRVSRFTGDGVVVATPTGSTAYSLSAGGPVVEPTARNIIVTPVCAHALEAKPYVLAENRRVTVEIGYRKYNPAYLCVDGGELIDVLAGDRLEVRKSDKNVVFAHISERSFYKRVSEKLGETL